MKIDWSFVRLSLGAFAGMCLLAAYPLSQFATPDIIRSVGAGVLMSLCNLLLGHAIIERSYTRSHTTFLKWVLGGMVVRLMLMWTALLLLLSAGFHSASLMLSLLFLYGVNLVLEIHFLQKKVDLKSQAISS